jgi:hypothetical protein
VDRLLLKMPVRLGPMAQTVAKGANIRAAKPRDFANALRTTRSTFSINKELARSLQNFDEFRVGDFAEWVKNDVVFQSEKALRTNKARLIDLAALTIGTIQRNGKPIRVRATGDLAENQIRAWKIGNHKSGSTLSAIGPRKRNDNDFAGYRFDHAVSSSGELQSGERTDSLSSAPLNGSSTSSSIKSRVLTERWSHNQVVA